ncbi:hypothetical protein Prudu_008859 [Prunus dulcis]|uniref:Transposable element protein n=1 Tax=Prunus dulcis TaxID=3755 RepID=A0A4Y1R538_PRUDU|nr:hypothetical protein Prudu_008859 [Prunus dulcis]
MMDLGEVFELKDMCKLKYFLGLEVQYEANGKVFVTQAKYARDLIKKAAMDTCKPRGTPSNTVFAVNTICQFMRTPTDVGFQFLVVTSLFALSANRLFRRYFS